MTLALSSNIPSTPPFPHRLRAFRARNGLSHHKLATRLGISPVTVVRWENGTAKPNATLAEQLRAIGLGEIFAHETNLDQIPQIKSRRAGLLPGAETSETTGAASAPRPNKSILIGGRRRRVQLAPYVENGPPNQVSFFNTLLRLQGTKTNTKMAPEVAADRLSAVSSVMGLADDTSQSRLESPRATAAHWNANYGPHGWHRYIGRFPPHLVRALLNHFGANEGSVVCDPFAGSGTTLVECRLLGIPAVGIEICPLSALITTVKSRFPSTTTSLRALRPQFGAFYDRRWAEFTRARSDYDHATVLRRRGNPLGEFPNYEKWLTPQALLGVSIVLEFAQTLAGYDRDALLVALSSKMRSVGNVDVDVARAEYSRLPRVNVNVNKHVDTALARIIKTIDASCSSHHATIGPRSSVAVVRGDMLTVELPSDSVDYIITSPPYGVEASSYLRAHLLSYRCLYPFLGEDPYAFGDRVIGSEYVGSNGGIDADHTAGAVSRTFRTFFQTYLDSNPAGTIRRRAHMMMEFFADMARSAAQFSKWMRRHGQVAFVVGNKRLGDRLIPTDQIVSEIFSEYGFVLSRRLTHKLKCNNTNSQVPWQERVIQDESVLFFRRR